MRARQILFGICMAALLVSGLYSGERFFFMGFYIMLVMLVLSIASIAYTSLTFKYLQSLTPAEGVKGDTLEYRLQVHNDMLFPIAYIRLTYDSIDSLLSGEQASVTMSLTPRTHGEHTQGMFCRYRGRWPVGVKKAEIRDIFGLISIRLDINMFLSHKPISLLVRPRILRLPILPMRRRNDEGPMETAPRRSDDVAMLADIRKYHPGDQMKRIHWKLTARQREVMVKNYEETSLPDLLLYLDTKLKPMSRMDRLNLEDTLVESATAVVHHLLQNDMPTSLIFYSDKRVHLQASKPEHFQSIYSVLSEMPFDGKWDACDVLMNDLKLVTHAGNLFLITSSLSDKLFDLLIMMNSSGMSITMVYVREPVDQEEMAIKRAVEVGRARRMVSEMRDAGIVVIDMAPGDNLAERVGMMR